MRKKLLIWVLLLAMLSAGPGLPLASASFSPQAAAASQEPTAQDELVERALVELAHLRRATKLDATRIAALNELIAKLEEQIAAEQAVSDKLRLANVERQRASRIEEERWASVQSLIDEMKLRIVTLTAQRDKARGRLITVGAFALIVGGILGWAVARE